MPDVLATATVVVGGEVDPGIARDVSKAFDNVDDALDDAAAAFARLDNAIQDARAETSRAFGELNESSNLARDGFGDLSSSASAIGAGLASVGLVSDDTAAKFTGVADALGGAEGAFTAVKGASSLAGGAFTALQGTMTKIPGVTKAVTVAQRALNLVLKANPIGLVVTAIALLAAGFVIAYKKSQTFRNIVNGAFNGIKAAASAVFGFVTKYIQTQITIWTTLFNGVKKVLGSIWTGVSAAARKAFNGLLAVLRPIATVINAIITAANAVDGPGGINIPKIPKFASGVRNFRGGLAVVGEAGPEVVSLPAGSDVYSNRDSQRLAGNVQNNTYIFQGPESFAAARANSDWAAKHGTRFGNATRAVRPA